MTQSFQAEQIVPDPDTDRRHGAECKCGKQWHNPCVCQRWKHWFVIVPLRLESLQVFNPCKQSGTLMILYNICTHMKKEATWGYQSKIKLLYCAAFVETGLLRFLCLFLPQWACKPVAGRLKFYCWGWDLPDLTIQTCKHSEIKITSLLVHTLS